MPVANCAKLPNGKTRNEFKMRKDFEGASTATTTIAPASSGKLEVLRNDMGIILAAKHAPAIAYPTDTTETVERMISRYSRTGRTQNVSFRSLVSWIKMGERATHYLHSYPAKLLPQIAHFFLSSHALSRPGDIVLDPFGGTGTVALEALLSGRNAYFADANPLALLIARVKTHPLDADAIQQGLSDVQKHYERRKDLPKRVPSVVNVKYWYAPAVIKALCGIRDAIEHVDDPAIRDFFRISFSATARRVSRADPRLSVPVRAKDAAVQRITSAKVWQEFAEQVANNDKRMQNFRTLHSTNSRAYCVGHDARCLKEPISNIGASAQQLESNSVSLIITSPPYAGAQKYIRASSLSLGWLGLAEAADLKQLENASIGREHFAKESCREYPVTNVPAANRLIKKIFKINPLRSVIAATYLNEMDSAIKEMARVLKPGAYLVLVIGNNEVCGQPFKSSDYLSTLCKQHGLSIRLKLIDEIKSRGLMTKRNKTASMITREWVLLFQKP